MAATEAPGTPAPTPEAAPAAKTAPKQFSDRMRDAGWTPESDTTDEATPPEPEKPAKGKQPKPKAAKPVEAAATEPANDTEKPAEAAQETAAELGARGLLEKLAKEQGFVIDDGKITTKQHAEFRLLKKEQREQLARAEQEAMNRVTEAQKGLEERLAKVEAFESALKNRDHQALAKAAGFEDWDKLQEGIVSWQDPAYLERKELREWKEKVEREQEQQAQQRQAQEQEQRKIQAENTYLGNLSTTMKTSQDALVQSMADDPLFLRAVYRIQQENWDGRETVTPEQAVRMAAQGSRVTLGEELKALHARLDKAFGKKPEEEAPKPAPKPKIAGGPKAAPSLPSKMPAARNERMRSYQNRLAEATERDRKTGTERY